MTGRLVTSLITLSQPLMLLLDVFVYDPLTRIVSLFLAADLARTTAVGLFITLARQSLPDELRNSDNFDGFKGFSKTILFRRDMCDQRIRGF